MFSAHSACVRCIGLCGRQTRYDRYSFVKLVKMDVISETHGDLARRADCACKASVAPVIPGVEATQSEGQLQPHSSESEGTNRVGQSVRGGEEGRNQAWRWGDEK